MKLKQYRITALSFLLIIYLSFMNAAGIPHSKFFDFERSDLIVHFLMYSFLSFVFFSERHKNIKTTKFPWIFIFLLILFGGTIEILQPVLSNRNCELFDFIANTSGVFWGYFFFGITHKYLKR